MDITLYRFSKRTNSTKRPSGSGIGTFACDFIQPTSIHNPSIILYAADISNILTANYAKFNNEYFYVSDIVINTRDSVTLQLNKDVLASFKTEIGNTTARVIYSTSRYDDTIADTRIAVKSKRISRSAKIADNDFRTDSTKWFDVEVIGDNIGAMAFTTHLLMTSAQLSEFVQKTMSMDIMKNISEFFGGNSMESAIVGCRYYPFNVSDFVGSKRGITTIYLGNVSINMTSDVYSIKHDSLPRNDNTVIRSHYFDLTNWNRGDFRDYGSYREVYLNLPYCSPVTINSSLLNGANYIKISTYIDVVNGNITHDIYAVPTIDTTIQYAKFITSISGSCSINIPVGQVSQNKDAWITAAIGATTSIAAFSAGEMTTGINSALSTLSALGDTTQIGLIGNMSSLPGAEKDNCLYALYILDADLTEEPEASAAVNGRPCYETVTINTLSGYVQTENASISADAPEEEINAVNAALNGGIYYE